MTGSCVACGAQLGPGAERCPGCGLYFGAAREGDPVTPPDPSHVSLYLGAAPQFASAVDDGSPVEVEIPPRPPRPPLDPRVIRRRIVVAGLAVAGAVALIVLLVRHYRPNDAFTAEERMFERFLDAPELARVEIPEAFDAGVGIAALGGAAPLALRTAMQAHRPFSDRDTVSVHHFFDAFLERITEVAPDYAASLGVAPFASDTQDDEDTEILRWQLLCRDASLTLRGWRDAELLPPHERTDRLALLGYLDCYLRWEPRRDHERLESLTGWMGALVRLADLPDAPAAMRAEAASRRLNELPGKLDALLARLENPPPALVLARARDLEDAGTYLSVYAAGWPGLAPEVRTRLELAATSARTAVTACVQRLRSQVVERATGTLAIGPLNTALVLRVHYGLPLDAREVFERATREFRAANDAMRELLAAGYRPAGNFPDSDQAQVRALRDAASNWLVAPLPDTGLTLVAQPSFWSRTAGASYLDGGTLSDSEAGVIHIGKHASTSSQSEGEYEALLRRHTLAHETYPGHRLEALRRRAACRLRRFVDDRVYVEGWAVYAEDLLHETDDCAGDAMDEYVRAASRAHTARHAMLGLLVATGAADDDAVVDLLEAGGHSDPERADAGDRMNLTLYPVTYFVGHDEILRLRRQEEARLGKAFDLRAFHERVLGAGPIPPRLIAEEWRALDR